EIGPGEHEQPVGDAEGTDRGEVLAALGLPALVGGDDEDDGGGGPETGQRRRDEPLVPRHVDERHVGAVRQRGPGEAQLDRQPAGLLLRQPVGIPPGQRPDERGLAVVDVPGRGEDTPHAGGATSASRRASSRSASRSGGMQRTSTSPRPSSTRARTAGTSPVGCRSRETASTGTSTAQPGSGTPGAPPPPTRPSTGTTARPSSSASRRARRRSSSTGAWRASWTGVEGPRSVASRAATVSLSTRSARASGWRRRRSTTSAS